MSLPLPQTSPLRTPVTATHRVRIGGYRAGMISAMVAMQVEAMPADQRITALSEARIATDIASFIQGFEPMCDLLMGAFVDDAAVGSIAVDGRLHGSGAAALRWFSIGREVDRMAVGRVLLDHAMNFCRERGFATVTLFHPNVEPELEYLFKQLGFRRQDPGGPETRPEHAGSVLIGSLVNAPATALPHAALASQAAA